MFLKSIFFGLGFILFNQVYSLCRQHNIPDKTYLNLAKKNPGAITACMIRVKNIFGKITGSYSGVLVHSNWVLTAGHVGNAAQNHRSEIIFGNELSSFTQPIRITNWIFHLKWTGNIRTCNGYDLALARLEKPIRKIKPIQIYQHNPNFLLGDNGEYGLLGYFIGYGLQGDGITGPKNFDQKKRCGSSIIKKSNSGSNTLYTLFEFPKKADFASHLPSYGLASGDSGGPIFILERGIPKLVGIASGTGKLNAKKADFKYGSYNLFTSVADHANRNWIMKVISIK